MRIFCLGCLPLLFTGCIQNADCLDGGCFDKTSSGTVDCVEVSAVSVQFGDVPVGTESTIQEVVFSDLCEWDDSEITWHLDDPNNAFTYSIEDTYRILFSVRAEIVGIWEAQFSATHPLDEQSKFVQLFATTVESSAEP